MDYKISNEELEVTVSSLGGQYISMKDKAGVEYIWQGGIMPTCFPIVGSLRNKTAKVGNGRICTMERHGIAAVNEFELVEQKGDSITLKLVANENTKKAFPFAFEFQVKYTLSGKKLDIAFKVVNKDTENMPYQIGGHPAFSCPINSDGDYEDYILEFEEKETADCPRPIPATGLMDYNDRTRMLDNSNVLPITHDLFNVDAVFFENIKSRKVKLFNPNTSNGIEIAFAGFKNLVVWSTVEHNDFVAVEPWSGLTTCNHESDIFEEKMDVYSLAPNGSNSHSYSITVL